eukprot:597037-Rhodomonas_salina.1
MTVLAKSPKPQTNVVLDSTIICQRIIYEGLESILKDMLEHLDPDPCRDFIGEIPALIYPHVQAQDGTTHYDVTHMYLCVKNCDQRTQCPCTYTSAHAIFASPPTRDMGTPAAIATAAR